MKIKKKICFDIDGVICNTKKNDYQKAKPINKSIKKINQLYEEGNIIIIFTARFMGRSKENRIKAEKRAKKITMAQLNLWKVKYHKVIFGKPSFDLIIDDKSIFFKKNWFNLI